MTDYCASHGVASDEVAAQIRLRVREATGGLTCSVGAAPNQMLAKV